MMENSSYPQISERNLNEIILFLTDLLYLINFISNFLIMNFTNFNRNI